MSVLIKGMAMPYGCANCSFCSSPIYDCKGMATYCCNIDVEELRGKDVTEEVLNMWERGASESFPAWCPLIEVPKDVQPVVRCINCKYYEGLACCKLIGDCGGTNWFCGWSEPKEGI